MSTNRSVDDTFFMAEVILSFTAAWAAHMARCRFAQSEYELVEQAMRMGGLFLADARLAGGVPSATGVRER